MIRTKTGPGLRLGAAQLAASAPSPLLAPAGKDDGVKSDLLTTDGLESLSSDKKLVVKTAKGLAVEASDEQGKSMGGTPGHPAAGSQECRRAARQC